MWREDMSLESKERLENPEEPVSGGVFDGDTLKMSNSEDDQKNNSSTSVVSVDNIVTVTDSNTVHVSSENDKNRSNSNIVSSENEYESEPASLNVVDSVEARRKKKKYFRDGKTMHPKVSKMSREVRELAKKHLELEKNLKIEGMPKPPSPKIRKRRMSLGSNVGRDREVVFKRKRLNSLDVRPKKDHMPKWALHGGDATDPLNLNGLAHSEEGRLLNEKTPENSPLPTPDFRKVVFVKVPPNIQDPLNLEGKHDQRVIDMLLNATRRKRHRSKKNKDNINQNQMKDGVKPVAAIKPNFPDANEMKMSDVQEAPDDCIVSNQPPNAKSRARSLSMSPDRRFKRQTSGGKVGNLGFAEPKKYPEKPKFTNGNYNRYYGYRNQDHESDPRLRYLNPQWFEDKDVLDIGCNVGHLTLALADQFSPRKILGMDIDGKLIGAARQNIRQMLSQRRKDSSKYPSVFEMSRGPLEAHPLMGSSTAFPNNILFLQGNYVPGSEEILQLQKEEYDTILALSITKWIHLNNGDHGLKLFFQKIHRQLRPGGRLILEPQPWSTYRKRAKLSPELFKNYSSIKLKPESFKNYLLSIGFVKCEVIGVPVTKAKGFRRPLILFTKADPHSSMQPQKDPINRNDFQVCTECEDGGQSVCDHIQFTGMRLGAYADRMYDHISYRSSGPISSESASMEFYSGKRDSPFTQELAYYGASLIHSFRAGSHHSNTSRESEKSQSYNGSGSGSMYSGSERSWTSESTTGSSSSRSTSSYSQSSGVTSSGSLHNGHVNGIDDDSLSPEMNGIAADIQWVDNENANMEFENDNENVLPNIDDNGPLMGGAANGHANHGEG